MEPGLLTFMPVMRGGWISIPLSSHSGGSGHDSSAKVKWCIPVPRDLDEATRLFLVSQGGRKGSLSALVEKAVSRYILSSLTNEAKAKVRESGLSQSELDKIIADALAWAKSQNP